MTVDVVPVERANALAYQNALNVQLVLQPIRKSFHDHQILSATDSEDCARLHFNALGSVHGVFFERERAQSDVDANAFGAFKKKDAVLKCELSAAVDPGCESCQKRVDIGFLISKTGEESDVYIPREAGLSPVLNGETANKTKPPSMPFAFSLYRERHATKLVHDAANFRKSCCCSTNPEVGAGGWVRTVLRTLPVNERRAAAVSASRTSRLRTFSNAGLAAIHVFTQRDASDSETSAGAVGFMTSGV
jgi:hypothetical protein